MRMYSRDLSYEKAKEIVEKGVYKHIAGRSEFESYVNFYCRQLNDNLLECIKIWRNDRVGIRGTAVLIGSPEEIYCWIPWDAKGTISSVRVKEALKAAFGIEVDLKKVDEAYRSMIKKVLGW